jgi:hypothetical protein
MEQCLPTSELERWLGDLSAITETRNDEALFAGRVPAADLGSAGFVRRARKPVSRCGLHRLARSIRGRGLSRRHVRPKMRLVRISNPADSYKTRTLVADGQVST